MRVCVNCNQKLKDDARFCHECGTVIVEYECRNCHSKIPADAVFCPECGMKTIKERECIYCHSKMPSDAVFCPECGHASSDAQDEKETYEKAEREKIEKEAQESAEREKAEKAERERIERERIEKEKIEKIEQKKAAIQSGIKAITQKIKSPFSALYKKLGIKKIVIGSAVIVIAISGSVATYMLDPFTKGEGPYILYEKNGELYFSFLNKIRPVALDSKFQHSIKPENRDMVSKNIYADTDQIFYPGEIDSSVGNVSAGVRGAYYCRNLKAENKEEEVKIVDEDVDLSVGVKRSYEDKTKLFYIQGQERTLICNDLNKKEKIDSGVANFEIDNGEGCIIYTKQDGKRFEKNLNSGALPVEIKLMTPTIPGIVAITKNGYYYTVKSQFTRPLSEYVTDDMKEKDASEVYKPQISDYKRQVQVKSFFGLITRYETVEDTAGYNLALSNYNRQMDERKKRQNLRTYIASSNVTVEGEDLYYSDGTNQQLVAKGYTSLVLPMEDEDIIVYKRSENNLIRLKRDLSSIVEEEEIYEFANNYEYSTRHCIAFKSDTEVLNGSDHQYFTVNRSGDALYYIEVSGSNTLYKLKLGTPKLNSPQVVAANVMCYRFGNQSDEVIVYKNHSQSVNDVFNLQVGSNSFATNVLLAKEYSFSNTSDMLYLMKNTASNLPVLKWFKDGENEIVAENVLAYAPVEEGNIVFIQSFEGKSNLVFIKDGETVKIDKDVEYLYPVGTDTDRDVVYYGKLAELL